MTIQLTRFEDDFLDRLSVCFRLRVGQELINRLPEVNGKIDWDSQYGNDYWLHLLIERWKDEDDDCMHFHIDTVKQFSGRKAPANKTLEEITSTIDLFFDVKGSAWIRARFIIPKDNQPKTGIVPVMTGVKVEFGDSKAQITGGRLTIEGDDFDELIWRLDDSKGLVVDIDGFVDLAIDDTLLVNSATLLRSGLDKFLFPTNGESE